MPTTNQPKQIIVWRKDLQCRKGKFAAQVAHASMAAILNAGVYTPTEFKLPLETEALTQWLRGLFTKIVVSVDSEEELLALNQQVLDAGIRYRALITDCGATEFHGVPTLTCLAIGPDWPEVLNPLTGHLKLM